LASIRRPSSTSPHAEPRPLRVLIADDNPLYTELLLRLLGRHDWMVVVGCATNGRDAVALAAAARPELVLMDLNMPIMDGADATRCIREHAPVPVLVLTASAAEVDRERALAAGALAVLSKTGDPAELIGHLQNVFGARAA
jgi:CheY-like chemotaxis protein